MASLIPLLMDFFKILIILRKTTSVKIMAENIMTEDCYSLILSRVLIYVESAG